MFDQLKNLKEMASLMGNMGDMRSKIEGLEEKLGQKTVEADSGAGAVRVVMNGKCQVVSLRIEPAMLAALAGGGAEADRVMVEELITAAVNAAVEKAHVEMKDTLGELAGGMNLPGV